MNYVAGYTLAVNLTNGYLIKDDTTEQEYLSRSIRKTIDNPCAVSNFIEKSRIPDPQDVRLWLNLNGVMRQDVETRDMTFDVAYLISWLSHRLTLERGDLILTGTPKGVGPVRNGDVIQCGLNDVVMTSRVKLNQQFETQRVKSLL